MRQPSGVRPAESTADSQGNLGLTSSPEQAEERSEVKVHWGPPEFWFPADDPKAVETQTNQNQESASAKLSKALREKEQTQPTKSALKRSKNPSLLAQKEEIKAEEKGTSSSSSEELAKNGDTHFRGAQHFGDEKPVAVIGQEKVTCY